MPLNHIRKEVNTITHHPKTKSPRVAHYAEAKHPRKDARDTTNIAQTYRQLVATLRLKPESQRVDVLAAELASSVARGDRRTVDIVVKGQANRHQNAADILKPYGIDVRFIYRTINTHNPIHSAWVVLRQSKPQASEFTGATVRERQVTA